MTYYSGYQFCYTTDTIRTDNSQAQSGDGQNPMMNFIGSYTNGRAMMEVSCIGMYQGSVTIKWSSSAAETTVP